MLYFGVGAVFTLFIVMVILWLRAEAEEDPKGLAGTLVLIAVCALGGLGFWAWKSWSGG